MKKSVFIFAILAFFAINLSTFAQSKNKIATREVRTNNIVPYADGSNVTINGVIIPLAGVVKPVNVYSTLVR